MKDATKYQAIDFAEFQTWLDAQTEYEYDVETYMTDKLCNKRLRTIQFGDTSEDLQFVLEWALLTQTQRRIVKASLESYTILKLIHSVSFEYVIMRFHGIEIHNVYDTMLGEKVMNGGIENENYALTDLTWKYLEIILDKEYQTRFGEDVLTSEHAFYAAQDVKYLSSIRHKQVASITEMNLLNVLKLENKAALAFSDITYYGMTIDPERWRSNIKWAQPALESSEAELNRQVVERDVLRAKAIELKFLSEEDQILLNPNSYKQKLVLLQWLFPNIHGSSLIIMKQFYASESATLPPEKLAVLAGLIAKDYSPLQTYVVNNHRAELVEKGWLVPAETMTINWNSVDQAKALLKAVAPRMRSMNKETIARQTDPIFEYYSEFKDKYKAVSTYGEKFLNEHVEPDGRVRTNFNQIISTGRVSSSKPNMQNIPAVSVEQEDGSYKYIYRDPFGVNTPGFVFVSSDFSGQELGLIAHIAKDEKWFEAIKKGWDLHSMTAEMVFGKKWTSIAEPDCAYASSKKKCKCHGHGKLRNAIKTINFGLAYGMSAMKLASTLRITKKEAEAMIADYFKAFPRIKVTLDFLGKFGVEHGYITTLAPFFRRRTFPQWKYAKKHVQAHVNKIMYDKTLGAIERQSKNAPIQGSGGDMMKLAMVLVYEWIRENNYVDRINMVMQVHDQLDTECEAALSDMWAKELDALMGKAGNYIVTSGILKADTHISPRWTK